MTILYYILVMLSGLAFLLWTIGVIFFCRAVIRARNLREDGYSPEEILDSRL